MKKIKNLQGKFERILIRATSIALFVVGASQAFADKAGISIKPETGGEMTDTTKYLILGAVLVFFIAIAVFVQKISERD